MGSTNSKYSIDYAVIKLKQFNQGIYSLWKVQRARIQDVKKWVRNLP